MAEHDDTQAASPVRPDGGGGAEVRDDTDVRDELPSDLDARGHVGPYRFPDNSRRRVPGALYLVIAAGCLVTWLVRGGGDAVLVNDGFLLAAVVLALAGVYSISAGWRLGIDEKGALERASAVVGWPIGHASAQLAWRGLRSRPTWRVLCYSAEEPPRRRGFVLIDAVDGREVDHLVEDNPEDWATAG
jgi:hypothetical protein